MSINEPAATPLGGDALRDAQIRALVLHHETVARQIAELSMLSDGIHSRLASGDGRMDAIEAELRANTEVTTEVRDLLSAVKGGFKVLGWLGHGGKWAGMIAGAAVSLYTLGYALTHGGQLPPGK